MADFRLLWRFTVSEVLWNGQLRGGRRMVMMMLRGLLVLTGRYGRRDQWLQFANGCTSQMRSDLEGRGWRRMVMMMIVMERCWNGRKN